MRVIIVDDDKNILDLCETLLKRNSIDFMSFQRFHDAIPVIEEGLFDLLLLDKTLPDIKFEEMYEILKKYGIGEKTVLMTGDSGFTKSEIIKSVVVKDVLFKPFYLNELIDILKK